MKRSGRGGDGTMKGMGGAGALILAVMLALTLKVGPVAPGTPGGAGEAVAAPASDARTARAGGADRREAPRPAEAAATEPSARTPSRARIEHPRARRAPAPAPRPDRAASLALLAASAGRVEVAAIRRIGSGTLRAEHAVLVLVPELAPVQHGSPAERQPDQGGGEPIPLERLRAFAGASASVTPRIDPTAGCTDLF